MTPTVFKFHYYPTKGYTCSQAGDNTGYYVTLNDYERLQADNARLQAELEELNQLRRGLDKLGKVDWGSLGE